jgi:CBS domain containing-hemolysin-like protein
VFAFEGGDGSVTWNLLALLTVPALIILNGLFVAAEFALVAVRKTRIEEMVQQQVPGAPAVLNALHSLDRSIAATQLGVTLASIGLGFVGEPALADLLLPLFAFLPEAWRSTTSHGLAIFVAFLLITFFHIVFGELLPKSMSLQSPDRVALWLSRPLLLFSRVSRPFILLVNGTGNFLLRRLGYRSASAEEAVHSVDELLLLIEDTEEAGILDSDQADLLENVFRLADKRVHHCMVSREKMATLEANLSPDQVLEAVRSGAHTRMPVYEGDLDNIVGIVNTKDLFYLFSLQGVVILQDALYPALYLEPEEDIANALRLFRRSRRHMALVRTEEGHILGLITLEDILEEIVGDIEDEHDRPTPKLTRRPRRVAPVPASPPGVANRAVLQVPTPNVIPKPSSTADRNS